MYNIFGIILNFDLGLICVDVLKMDELNAKAKQI